MSHFTTLQTRLIEREFILRALADMGLSYEVGDSVEIHCFGGRSERGEIRIPTHNAGYDIGLRKAAAAGPGEAAYEILADWWGIHGAGRNDWLTQADFVKQLTQRYAYHAAVSKLAEQGFAIAAEEQAPNGQVHLTLRRVSG